MIRDLPPELIITADPSPLVQVLDNVLSNAIKFTPTGGRITLTALQDGDGVDVIVKDTGMGIDAGSCRTWLLLPNAENRRDSHPRRRPRAHDHQEHRRGTPRHPDHQRQRARGNDSAHPSAQDSPARATGGIAAGLGLAQDVTEARAAEHTLKESEERNRLTFEHAPTGQAIVELDGGWRQVNAALTRLLGYSEDQLLKMTFQDITHPDDLELDLTHLNRLIAGRSGPTKSRSDTSRHLGRSCGPSFRLRWSEARTVRSTSSLRFRTSPAGSASNTLCRT